MQNNVILFYGEDTFYIKSKIQQTIKQLGADDFNTTTYDLDEVSLTDAINDARTIPFMADLKVVIVTNAMFLNPSVKTKQKHNHDIDYLNEYLENPTDETVFIVSAPLPKLDERLAIVKRFKKMAEVVACKLKTAQDLVSWARRQIGNLGIHIEQDALDEFIKRVAHSTEFAYLEMKKLLLYAHDIKTIDKHIIEKVITKNIEDNVYEITNAILSRNHQKALEVYQDLILYSEDPLRILGIIIRKYREMLHVKVLLKQGKNQLDIQNHFSVSSGRAYYMIQNAKVYDQDKIEEHLKHLERLDYAIKTGRVDKKMALELFILST